MQMFLEMPETDACNADVDDFRLQQIGHRYAALKYIEFIYIVYFFFSTSRKSFFSFPTHINCSRYKEVLRNI